MLPKILRFIDPFMGTRRNQGRSSISKPLSEGSIINFIFNGQIPPSGHSIFQVLATRKIQDSSQNNYIKYRLCFSDGKHKYSKAVLLIDKENDVPPNLSIIEIDSEK